MLALRSLRSAAQRSMSAAAPAVQVTVLKNGVTVASTKTDAAVSGVTLTTSGGSCAGDDGVPFALHSVLVDRAAPREGSFNIDAATITVVTEDVSKAMKSLAETITAPITEEEAEVATDMKEFSHMGLTVDEETDAHAHSVAFQSTPYGSEVYGSVGSVFTADSLNNLASKVFTGKNVVVSVSGPASHEDTVKAVEASFGSLETGEALDTAPVSFTGSEARDFKDTKELQMTFSLPAPAAGSKDAAVFQVLAAALGDWNTESLRGDNGSSLMIEEIAGDKSATAVSGFYHGYKSAGMLGVRVSSDRKNMDDALYAACAELVRFSTTATDEHLNNAKEAAIVCGLSARHSQGPVSQSAALGLDVLRTGAGISDEEYTAAIRNLSVSDIKKVASNYIYDTCPAIAYVGDATGITDYNRARGWTSSLLL